MSTATTTRPALRPDVRELLELFAARPAQSAIARFREAGMVEQEMTRAESDRIMNWNTAVRIAAGGCTTRWIDNDGNELPMPSEVRRNIERIRAAT